MNLEKYLRETRMLDYSNSSIQELIRSRGWREIEDFERIKSIYNFVRDEILFGYNIDDDIPASRVLSDGYGQCNTKGHCLWHCFVPVIFRVEYMDLQSIRNYRKVL